MKNLVCPHCKTVVDATALVCRGCGAEIVHGASRREKMGAGCLIAGGGLLVTMAILGVVLPAYKIGSESGLTIIVGLIIAAVTFNALGSAIVTLICRFRLRIYRASRHQ